MIYALNFADEIRLSAMTNELDYHFERSDSLRYVVFYLISFKHFVHTNKEHENDTDNKPVNDQ